MARRILIGCGAALVGLLVLVGLMVLLVTIARQVLNTELAKEAQEQASEATTQATGPSTTSNSNLAARIIGTWEVASFGGFGSTNPAAEGGNPITFYEDGTVQGEKGRPGQYSLLDDSHVQVTFPNGTSYVLIYDSNADTLSRTFFGATLTYQRKTD